MKMTNTFRAAVCIVTGAASGIGKALSEHLAAQGAIVIATDVNGETVAEVAQQFKQGESHAIDVSDRDAVHDLVNGVVERFGKIDYMFNNAGINVVGEFQDLTHDDWRRIMDVNLWGVVYGCEAAYAHMVSQGSGHIVNMSSGLGITPAPRNSAYSASKFAVVGLSEALRIEGKDLGVNVSVVCPGWIKTPMLEEGRVAGQKLSIGDVASHFALGFADVNKTAKAILKRVRRRKPIITYPAYVRPFQLLYQLLRPISDWWNQQEIRAFRKQCKNEQGTPPTEVEPERELVG